MQTRNMDQLEQEVHELRGEVTTLRTEIEELNSLVSPLTVMGDQPLCPKWPQQQIPQQVIPQNQVPRQVIPQKQVPRKIIPHNQVRKASQCDPIPWKYAELLPDLFRRHLVQTRPPPQKPKKLPSGYGPDLFCAFHQGAPGHDIEQCSAFQKVVQKLVRKKPHTSRRVWIWMGRLIRYQILVPTVATWNV